MGGNCLDRFGYFSETKLRSDCGTNDKGVRLMDEDMTATPMLDSG